MRVITSSPHLTWLLYVDDVPITRPFVMSTRYTTTVVVPMSTAAPYRDFVTLPGKRSSTSSTSVTVRTVAVTFQFPSRRTRDSLESIM